MEHRMKLWHGSFIKIAEGTKTIEMRLFDEKRSAISPGDTMIFTDISDGAELACSVAALHRYPSFLWSFTRIMISSRSVTARARPPIPPICLLIIRLRISKTTASSGSKLK